MLQNQNDHETVLKAILGNIKDAVFVVDLNSNIILLNSEAERLSGYKQEEAQGENYQEIFKFKKALHEDQPFPDLISRAIKDKKFQLLPEDTIIIAKNNEKIPVSHLTVSGATPFYTDQGEIKGCIFVFRDASEEQKVNQAKDELFSIAAHQLKTPLGSMRWNMDLLLVDYANQISQEAKELLTEMRKSDITLIQLVNDLLSIKRLEQGRLKNEPEMFNIHEVIENVLNEVGTHAKEKNVTITVNKENIEVPQVFIDKFRFHEVIMNLLSNAVKYNRQDGVVEVNFSLQPDVLQISVKDTGMGISKDSQEKIFSKYFRADNALNSKIEGTGLGLSIVKSFIEEWRGKIWFESVENQGTTFFFTIPLPKSS